MKVSLTSLFDEAVHHLKTIGDVLRFAVTTFNQNDLYYGHGTTNAREEATYLISHTLNLPFEQLDSYLSSTLLPHELRAVLSVLKKRIKQKIPAPYLTNEAICQGYSFYVNQDVIIPRSFIAEVMVNDGLKPWVEHPELIHNVLDLCTGSGAIAIIAADHFYDSHVVASDIDANALQVAQTNIDNYDLNDQIDLIKSNLFTNLKKYKAKFDIIFTNPPYVDSEVMSNLPAEYLHEPNLALAGGKDGLSLIDKILMNAATYLSDHGILVVEMGNNQDELEQQYPNLPFHWLETQSGDGFVFVLTKQELVNNL